MSTFVEVPRDRMEAYLTEMGFQRAPLRGEVTYTKIHEKNPMLMVKVYTSIAEQGAKARAKGEDAIRVVSLFTWKRQNENVPRCKILFQAKVLRVTSVDGVLERMREKAREAYAACNEFNKTQFRR